MNRLGPLELSLGRRPSSPVAEWRIAKEEAEAMVPKPMEGWWQRLFAWLFVAAGMINLFYVARSEPSQQLMVMTLLQSLFMVALGEAVLMILLIIRSNDVNLGPGLKRVRAKIPVDDAVPVSISLSQKGTITGADQGYVWLSDGTLFYKGLQCVFRLNREDILSLDKWPRRHLPKVDKGQEIRRIYLQVGERECVMGIKPIDPFEDFGTRRRAHQFQIALADWIFEKPEGEIETVLPPLEVHPSLMVEGPGRREGLVSGIALVVINLAFAATARPDFDIRSLAGFASVLHLATAMALTFFSVRFALQQYLDLNHRRAVFLENELSGPL